MRCARPLTSPLLGRAKTFRTYSTQPKAKSSSTKASSQRQANAHFNLSSFLEYAERTKLDTQSTIYVGTHYEYTALQSLARLGLRLTRSGGAHDKGIDLVGSWHLPEDELKVLVQCKAHARKVDPKNVRELEGTFHGAPASWRVSPELLSKAEKTEEDWKELGKSIYDAGIQLKNDVMALLVTPKEATEGVRSRMGGSHFPMGFVKLNLDGRVEQLLWNRSAAERGLQGLGITTRYIRRKRAVTSSAVPDDDDGDEFEKEVVLLWKDELWEWREEALQEDQQAGPQHNSTDRDVPAP